MASFSIELKKPLISSGF
ncbi:hypothetical protein D029_0350A, partial [Vibrio parahaemolyticus 970107]